MACRNQCNPVPSRQNPLNYDGLKQAPHPYVYWLAKQKVDVKAGKNVTVDTKTDKETGNRTFIVSAETADEELRRIAALESGQKVQDYRLDSLEDTMPDKADIYYVDSEISSVESVVASKPDKSYVDTELGKKADKSYVESELGKKADRSYVNTELSRKADTSYVNTELDKKSDISYVDTELGKKADTSDMNAALALKADTSYVNAELDKKASSADVESALSLKADKTYVDTELAKKADVTYVDTELAKKSDTSYVDTELAKKSDTTYVDTELAKKSDTTYVDTELAKKSDTTYVDTELAKKIDLVEGGTEGNLPGILADGSLGDSGIVSSHVVQDANYSHITVTSDSVSDGTTTFDKYVHPTAETATAAAVKVGRDSLGHTVLGDSLGKGDVGLGNVDNTADIDKPISTATQEALNGKQPNLPAAVAGKFLTSDASGLKWGDATQISFTYDSATTTLNIDVR